MLGAKRFMWASIKADAERSVNVATFVFSTQSEAVRARNAVTGWIASLKGLHSINVDVAGWKLTDAKVRIFCIVFPDGLSEMIECKLHIDQNVMNLLHLDMEQKGMAMLGFGWIERTGQDQRVYFVDQPDNIAHTSIATTYFHLYRRDSSQPPKTLES